MPAFEQAILESRQTRSFVSRMAIQNHSFIKPAAVPSVTEAKGTDIASSSPIIESAQSLGFPPSQRLTVKSSTSRRSVSQEPESQISAAPASSTPLKDDKKRCFAFLLLPQFSSSDLASAINVLSLANRMAGRPLYQWHIVSKDGGNQVASDGLEIGVQQSIDSLDLPRNCRLVLCGGGSHRMSDKQLSQWLVRMAPRKIEIGSLNCASYLLAQAGLFDGYRCTSHWEHLQAMKESFPQLDISSQLFVVDRDRFSCSGGTGVTDLMLHMVERDWGRGIAASISETLVCERMRGPEEPQRIPLRAELGYSEPRLMEAISLMETNVEEPLLQKDLAIYTGVSTRQLERLFRKYLGCSPARYYLELRLTRSRQLLYQTNKSVTNVALACGFTSLPHFSKCYREFFGVTPREVRRQLEATLANPIPDCA